MKQIVVNGGETHGGLLTPKWVVEYYRRKGIKLFVYLHEFKDDDNYIYKLANANELDDNTCIYCPLYVTKSFGDTIENLTDEICEYIIEDHDMFKDREDELLIGVAKEINNKELIKIIEIPDDVEYNIVESDCGFSEWVEEKHRIWW